MGTYLNSSRTSRWLAWKGIFRTRIFEVVCFLGTCFFRADGTAGLWGGERKVWIIGAPMIYTGSTTFPPTTNAPVLFR